MLKKILSTVVVLTAFLGCSQIIPREELTVNLVGENLKEGQVEVILYEYNPMIAGKEAQLVSKKIVEIKEDKTEVKFVIEKLKEPNKHYLSTGNNSEFEIDYENQSLAKVYRNAENEIKIKVKK